jgi:hypothetical protein
VVRLSRRGGKGIEDGNVGEESKGGNEGMLGPAVDDVLRPGDDGESAGSEAEKEGMRTASWGRRREGVGAL